MHDFGELFHVGIRVPDLAEAMRGYTSGTGTAWARPQHRHQPVWLPGRGAGELELRFTYSSAGPVHLELLQGPPGSVWGGDEVPGPHHLGYWVEDVAATTEALVAQGWSLEAASRAPEDGYGAFTYVRSPAGILVEPVAAAVRPAFERWWAGGDL
ncbi:MAG TPA: VOC family protein [Acidimicrobiales bacterium]|nr:VOC family protein [Acidimicrobiales bacterium]